MAAIRVVLQGITIGGRQEGDVMVITAKGWTAIYKGPLDEAENRARAIAFVLDVEVEKA